MYVSTATALAYGLERLSASSSSDLFYTAGTGGWIRSMNYVTRSVTAQAYNNSNFIYITSLGTTVMPADNGTSSLPALNFDFAFTI